MQAVNLQLQSICFFLSTRAAKLSAYQNQSTTHQKSVFGGEDKQRIYNFVIMLFLSLFPMSSHIFTLNVPSFFICSFSSSSLLVLNFQSLCKSSAKLLCDSKVTTWNWQRTKSGILMRSWHLPNLNLKTSCICPIYALVKPKT